MSQATSVPIVHLSDNSSGSVVKNVAVSLFSFPQKILSQGVFLTLLLILILVAIIMLLMEYFKDSDNGSDQIDQTEKTPVFTKKNFIPQDEQLPKKNNSSVIILPGSTGNEPDEEIIIENPEEDVEEIN